MKITKTVQQFINDIPDMLIVLPSKPLSDSEFEIYQQAVVDYSRKIKKLAAMLEE